MGLEFGSLTHPQWNSLILGFSIYRFILSMGFKISSSLVGIWTCISGTSPGDIISVPLTAERQNAKSQVQYPCTSNSRGPHDWCLLQMFPALFNSDPLWPELAFAGTAFHRSKHWAKFANWNFDSQMNRVWWKHSLVGDPRITRMPELLR